MAYIKCNGKLINTDSIYYIDTNPETLVTIGSKKGTEQIDGQYFEDEVKGIIQGEGNFIEIDNYGFVNMDLIVDVMKTDNNYYSIKFVDHTKNLALNPRNVENLDDTLFDNIKAYTKPTGGGGGGGVTAYGQLSGKPKINGVTLDGSKTTADLKLVDETSIQASETKLQGLIDAKQNKLTAGANITITGDEIAATVPTVDLAPLEAKIDGKQDKLTAGANIEIIGNEIKANIPAQPGAAATAYTDLTNKPQINSVELDGNKTLTDLGIASEQSVTDAKTELTAEIEKKQNKLTAGVNITIDDQGVISSIGAGQAPDMSNYYTKTEVDGMIPQDTDTTYTAGNGLSLNDTEFAIDDAVVATVAKVDAEVVKKVDVEATLSGTENKLLDSKGLKTELGKKQDKVSTGKNVSLFNNKLKGLGIKLETENKFELLNENDIGDFYTLFNAADFDINNNKEVVSTVNFFPFNGNKAEGQIFNTITFNTNVYAGFIFDPMHTYPAIIGWKVNTKYGFVGMWEMNKGIMTVDMASATFTMDSNPSNTYRYQNGDIGICYITNDGNFDKINMCAVRNNAIIANSQLTYTINNGKTSAGCLGLSNKWNGTVNGNVVCKNLVGIKKGSKFITDGISDANIAEIVTEYKKAITGFSSIKFTDNIEISGDVLKISAGNQVTIEDKVLVYQDADQSIKQNNLVIHANKLYIAKENIDATAGWATDEPKMTAVDTDTLFEDEVLNYDTLQQNDTVKQGKLVIKDDTLYICKTEFAKGATFDDDKANLTATSVNVDLSQYYNKTEVDGLVAAKADEAAVVKKTDIEVANLTEEDTKVPSVKLVKTKIDEITGIANGKANAADLTALQNEFNAFKQNFAVNPNGNTLIWTEAEYNALGAKEDKIYMIKNN